MKFTSVIFMIGLILLSGCAWLAPVKLQTGILYVEFDGTNGIAVIAKTEQESGIFRFDLNGSIVELFSGNRIVMAKELNDTLYFVQDDVSPGPNQRYKEIVSSLWKLVDEEPSLILSRPSRIGDFTIIDAFIITAESTDTKVSQEFDYSSYDYHINIYRSGEIMFHSSTQFINVDHLRVVGNDLEFHAGKNGAAYAWRINNYPLNPTLTERVEFQRQTHGFPRCWFFQEPHTTTLQNQVYVVWQNASKMRIVPEPENSMGVCSINQGLLYGEIVVSRKGDVAPRLMLDTGEDLRVIIDVHSLPHAGG